jgi:hypothetical protein
LLELELEAPRCWRDGKPRAAGRYPGALSRKLTLDSANWT